MKHVTYLDPFRLLVFTYQVSKEENKLEREGDFEDLINKLYKGLSKWYTNF